MVVFLKEPTSWRGSIILIVIARRNDVAEVAHGCAVREPKDGISCFCSNFNQFQPNCLNSDSFCLNIANTLVLF